MSHGIHKDDVNRWFLVSNTTPGEPGFVLFGYAGDFNVTEVETGQANLVTFLTEDELEAHIDGIAGVDYYKDAVEDRDSRFQVPSGKYTPVDAIPEPESEE